MQPGVGHVGEQLDEAVDERLVGHAGHQGPVHHRTHDDVGEQVDVDHVVADLPALDGPGHRGRDEGVQPGRQRLADLPADPLGVPGRLGEQRGIRAPGGGVAQETGGFLDARAHVGGERAVVPDLDVVERHGDRVDGQLDLARPAPVERALGHAGLGGHVLHRHPGDALVGKHLPGRSGDRLLRGLLAGASGAAVAAVPGSSRHYGRSCHRRPGLWGGGFVLAKRVGHGGGRRRCGELSRAGPLT